MNEKKPFEIAKETLKQLTERKLLPTPLNYQNIYNAIAGTPHVPQFPVDNLREIAKSLPTKTPGQQKQKGLLDYAIDRLNWEGVQAALVAYGGFSPGIPDQLSSSASSVAALNTPSSLSTLAPALTGEFFVQIARMIEYFQPALADDDERFRQQTETLLRQMRLADTDAILVKQLLASYTDRLSFAAEDQAEIKKILHKLLCMTFENIGVLSLDELWLKGQMDALMTACAAPLTLRRLDDVERRLKDVIFKQKDAKGKAMQAQEELRQMLATFIDRLSQMAKSSDSFHTLMQDSARLVEQAKSIAEISPVMKEVMLATRNMAQDSKASHVELQAMKEHAISTASELSKLHQELDRVSAQARHDPLTGALNRKGLDEAMEREISNVRRKDCSLCISFLDIDNFKKINDGLGHSTGDAALTHLATVARECMRPQDNLARFGGEEFVILLPDTTIPMAIEVLTRLQRELTKRFFLSGAEKILITFSAGVVQLAADEKGTDAIKRADQAMYLAKRAGKNRVVAA